MVIVSMGDQISESPYLRFVRIANPHTIAQPHEVLPQIPTAVLPWNALETHNFRSHSPLRILHLNPVSCHSQKQRFHIICTPSISSGWDSAWGILTVHRSVSGISQSLHQITYTYLDFQLHQPSNKLIVDVLGHIVRTRQVKHPRFQSHCYKAVMKCRLICNCQRLANDQPSSLKHSCIIPDHRRQQISPPHIEHLLMWTQRDPSHSWTLHPTFLVFLPSGCAFLLPFVSIMARAKRAGFLVCSPPYIFVHTTHNVVVHVPDSSNYPL